MKKSFLIIIALVNVIIGCKVDDAGFPSKSSGTALLYGTWYEKALITSGSVSGADIPATTTTDFTVKDYYTFNTDNTVNVSTTGLSTVSTVNYSYSNTSAGQKIVLGSGNGYAGLTYTINKLTTDSLILANTISATQYGISITTNTILKLAHK